VLAQHFYDYVSGLGDRETPRREGKTDADTYTLGFTYASPDNPLIDFNSKVYYTTTETEQNQIEPILDPQPWRNFKIATTGFDVFNTSRVDSGTLAHKITYGIDAFHDEVTVDDPFSTAALFTPNGERTVWGGFIEDEVKVTSWLRAIGAVRYDSYKLEGGGFEGDGDHVSPRGTLAVTPVKGIEIYGTWAEGYRAPAVTETLVTGAHPQIDIGIGLADLFTFLPNPALQPEVGQNKELGFNLKYDNVLKPGDKLRGKFSAYRNDVEDYIDLVAFGPPTTVTFCPAPVPGCPPVPTVTIPFNSYSLIQYQNIGNARIEGLEAELAYDWVGGFLNVSATHTNGKAEDGTELSSIPPDRASATLGFRFLDEKLVLGTRVTVVDGKQFTGLGNDIAGTLLSAHGYTLVDLFGSYNFSKWTSVDLIVNNVGDVDYNKYLDSRDSAGVQGRVALTVKLGEDGFDIPK
jgi:hemoglobin/transferrin/lactoferrin receptor protein